MELHLPYKLLILSIAHSLVIAHFFNTANSNLIFSGTLIIVGLILGLWCKRTIKNHKTTLDPSGKPTSLIVSGPFRFSRNPMYVSYLLVAFGFAVYSNSWIGFVGPVLYFIYLNSLTIPKEEQNLNAVFPNDYPAYATRVRRWL